ncbi:MAG: hypothetical protein KDE28_12730, partial [Anaerolineales bacterium]|nr:hypothetical protein [Anaerolineales bacterium]
MSRVNPPFRADHVGSLLRPPEVLQARVQFRQGEIDAAALRAVEDNAIAAMVKKVESLGMQAVTDGEFRREFFHLDFLKQLAGVSVTGGIEANPSAPPADDGMQPPKLSV